MKIIEVELLSDNLEETALFYAESLGLHTIEKTADFLSIKAGASTLLFKHSINKKPVYHIAFTIPENTLDEALIWVSSKTKIIPAAEESQVAEFAAWNARAFYFYDNNGNVLEFIARFDLQNATNEPFTSDAISCISEVAVVTENVRKYSAQLSKLTGVETYAKQPIHDNFAALGDAYGLFIISEEGRNWFPTDKASKKFPVRIKFQSGDLIREISLNSEEGS